MDQPIMTAAGRRRRKPATSVIEAQASVSMPVVQDVVPTVAAPLLADQTIEPAMPALDPVAPPAAVPAAPQTKDMTMDNETMTAAATDQMHTMFADVDGRARGAMDKGARMVEELAAFNKGNLEALVESSKIAARGLETMGQGAVAYAKQQLEESTATIKSLTAVKSPTEFLQMQSELLRRSFDRMVAQTSRSTEMMLKLAGEVAQPISNRVALAAEKMKIAA